MFRLPSSLIIAAIAALGVACGARAQSCSTTSVSGNFGSVNVLSGAAVDANASFTVTCSGTANSALLLCIEFNRGTLDGNQRALSSGSNFLEFELYSNAALTNIWGAWAGGNAGSSYPVGNGAGVTVKTSLNGSGSYSGTFTLYGAVLASQQTTIPGTYTWSHGAPYVGYAYYTNQSCPITPYTNSSTNWTATVSSNCNVSTTTLNFGSSGTSITSPVDSTATITVQCTNTTPYSIGLGSGANASGSQNRMAAGSSQYLNYNLYTDSGYSHPWTTTTSTTSCTGGANTCVLGTGTGANQNVTVYGQVPVQTAPASGTYTDSVVVTVTF